MSLLTNKWDKITLECRIQELESENKTLKLEQKQCLLCTAKHKEEKAELIERIKRLETVLCNYGIYVKNEKHEEK